MDNKSGILSNKRVLFILMILFVGFIVIGSSFATDVNDYDDGLNSVNSLDYNNDFSVNALNSNNINRTVFNESDFKNALNGDCSQIILGNDINLNNQIVISKNNLIIDGNGYAFRPANNFKAPNEGGAIYLKVNGFKLINCNFYDFSADYGGAIYADAQNVIIDNCSFFNCSANDDGGAIYFEGNKTTINNCNFIDCFAKDDGGSIYWEGHHGKVRSESMMMEGYIEWWEGDEFKLINCTFINSHAGDCGGAIDLSTDYSEIIRCTFINCSAGDDGGAVSFWSSSGCDGRVKHSVFVNCIAGDDGNAIYWDNDDGEVINCSFYVNKEENLTENMICWDDVFAVGDEFSCVFKPLSEYEVDKNKTTPHERTEFVDVYDEQQLQEALNNEDVYEITLKNYIKLTRHLYVYLDDVRIDGNGKIIFASSSDYTEKECGGAIFWEGNNGYIYNCIFEDTSAEKGGALCFNANGCKLENCSFNNVEANEGGAIYINGNNFNITDCSFISTDASDNGGAIYCTGSNGLIEWCKFLSTEGCVGGGIYMDGTNISVNQCVFNSSHYSTLLDLGDGGAIYSVGDKAKIYNSDFYDCYSGSNGGAIRLNGYRWEIINCTFSNDEVSWANGGAIEEYGGYGLIDNCIFNNCYADEFGGAILLKGGNCVISNSEFSNCEVDEDNGGAIYLLECEDYKIINCTFKDNTSPDNGGAIYAESSNGDIINSTFISNDVDDYGGAIYIHNGACNINDSTFTSNHADDDGGAIYVDGGNINIINSKFSSNSADDDGGALFIENGNCKVINCIFTNDNADDCGGAIECDSNGCNVTGSTFNNCRAGDDGGAIMVYNADNFVIDYSEFNACHADDDGGALFVNSFSDNAKVLNSLFVGCSAGDCGGAIEIDGNNAHIDNCTFVNGSAGDDGKIIFWNELNGKITNSMFFTPYSKDVMYWSQPWYKLWGLIPSSKTGTVKNCYYFGPNQYVKIIDMGNPSVSVAILPEVEGGLIIDDDGRRSISYGGPVECIVAVAENDTGVVLFSFDNQNWVPIKIINGVARYEVLGLDAGDYILFVRYDGKNGTEFLQSPFSIIPLNTKVTVDPISGKAGETVIIPIKVTDENGNPVPSGTVLVKLNDKIYKTTVKNGIATIKVVLPKAGSYNLVVYFEGDNNHNASYDVVNVKVIEDPSNSNLNPNLNSIGNMENTGNPLLVLLIALGAIGLESFRRKL